MKETPKISLINACLEVKSQNVTALKKEFLNIFGSKKVPIKLQLLKDLNFEINDGEKVGIIGRNGSGKSTLLKAIAGIYPLTSGTTLVTGNIAPFLEVGAGFQSELTGRENINLYASYLKMSPKEVSLIIEDIIDFSELRESIETPVKYYSSGMYMKLAFSIAMKVEAEVFLFDEIFAVGDISFVAKARSAIESLMNKAKILVLVSHDLGQIAATCNRVLILKDGMIQFDGDVSDGISKYKEEALQGT